MSKFLIEGAIQKRWRCEDIESLPPAYRKQFILHQMAAVSNSACHSCKLASVDWMYEPQQDFVIARAVCHANACMIAGITKDKIPLEDALLKAEDLQKYVSHAQVASLNQDNKPIKDIPNVPGVGAW